MCPTIEELGFNNFHRVKLAVNEQIINTNQQFQDNSIPWEKIADIYTQVTLKKLATSNTGNALDVLDYSNDNNASTYLEYSGNSAGKDVQHIELGTGMTRCRTGQAIEKEAGIAEALQSLDNKAGAVDEVSYMRNQAANGKVFYYHQDNALADSALGYARCDAPQPIFDLDAQGNGSHFKFQGDPTVSAPSDGEFWFDGTFLKMRIGATTYNFDMTPA